MRARARYPAEMTGEQLRALLEHDMSEKVWQQQVVELAESLGYTCYHTEQVAICECCRSRRCPFCIKQRHLVIARGSDPGWRDLVIGKEDPPRLLFPELKTNHGAQKPAQRHWQAILEANGQYAPVWRPRDRDDVREILLS